MGLLRCEHGLQMSMLLALLDQAQSVQPAQTTRSGKRVRQLRFLPIIQEHVEVEPLLLTPQVPDKAVAAARRVASPAGVAPASAANASAVSLVRQPSVLRDARSH